MYKSVQRRTKMYDLRTTYRIVLVRDNFDPPILYELFVPDDLEILVVRSCNF